MAKINSCCQFFFLLFFCNTLSRNSACTMNVYLANAELRPELEKIPTIPESSNGYMYQESKNVDMVKETVVQESN